MDTRFVVDTNVILNDPHCFSKFGPENAVLLPLVVLKEVDNFKNGHSSNARAARTANRKLDDFRETSESGLHESVDLPNGGTLQVLTNRPDTELDLLNDDVNDDIIIEHVYHLNQKFDDVVLVTEDSGLRVRANSLGLQAQGYENNRVENEQIFDEPKEVYAPGDRLDELKRNQSPLVLDHNKDLEPNEGVIVRSTEDPENHTGLARHLGCGTFQNIDPNRLDNTFGIGPRNVEQALAMDLLLDPDVELVCLSGKAGVGKTLLALAAGLQQCTHENTYEKMKVARPIEALEGNELGFLPGTMEEKLAPWMKPIYDNVEFLFKKSDDSRMKGREGYEQLKQQAPIDEASLGHMRGRSIPDSYILVDEVQNCSPHEIKTIVTRAGQGSKIICTGDPYQIDNPYLDQYSNGLSHLIDRMSDDPIFGYVNLLKGERSPLAEKAAEKL